MDTTLYALLMNTLEEQTECNSWNGFKIEVVNKLPEIKNQNTIYLVIVLKEEYINTLIKENEFDEAVDFVEKLYINNVDAIITINDELNKHCPRII